MLNTIRFGFKSEISDLRLSRQRFDSEQIKKDKETIQDIFGDFNGNKNIESITMRVDDPFDEFNIVIKDSDGLSHDVLISRQYSPFITSHKPEKFDKFKKSARDTLTKALEYWS